MSRSGRLFRPVRRALVRATSRPFRLRMHKEVYVRTDGRLGHNLLPGRPTLLLRTRGRRSGTTRTSALIYGRDGERYLIVPSDAGSPRAPAWLHNLRADSDVEIQIGRERRRARAEVIARGDPGFDRLWKTMNDINPGSYDRCQSRTSRQIPVVVLTPAGNDPD